MFAKIAAFEFRYQIRQPVFWVVGILFFLFAFGSIASDNIRIGFGPNVHKNAPYALAVTHVLFATLFMFVTTAFVANVVVRDDESGFGPLIRTTRIAKFDYLYGRFIGAFLAACVSFLAVPLALLVGSLMPWVDKETLGVFSPGSYLWAYFVAGLPALFVTSAVFFTLATVTRSMMWTYVGVVGFFILRMILLSVLTRPELRDIAALWDPFGAASFGNVTRYWTTTEMNTQLPPLTGLLLWNKLLWGGLAVGALALAYPLFQFQTGALRGKRLKAAKLAQVAAQDTRPIVAAKLASPRFDGATALAQLWARTRLDMGQVFLSPAYFVLLAIGVLFALAMLWLVTDVGQYGGVIYPVTRVMLDRLTTSFTIVPMIIAIYYSGELVWREREKKTQELIDASAVPNWAFVAPKVLAISLVLASTMIAGAVVAVVIQGVKGYFNFELGKTLVWLIIPQTFDFILLAALAVFIQTLSPHKFVGWAIMVVYMIAGIVANNFGFEDYLYNYGGASAVPLSDMNGQGHYWVGAWWFRLYWAAFAVMLLVVANAVWRRGSETRLLPRILALPRRLAGRSGLVFGGALVAFVGLGGFIYLNTHVLNPYRTERGDEKWTAEYEHTLLPFETTPQPKIIAMTLKVDIQPHQPSIITKGSYIIQNRTNAPLKEVHVRFDRDLKVSGLSIEGARPKQTFDRFNYRIFTFDTPMVAGETRTMSFTTERSQRGFRNSGNDTRVVDNGTFINSAEIAPMLGMDRSGLLQDRSRRRKLDLPADPPRMAPLGDVPSRQFNYLRHDADFVTSDITVSTVADQTPMAPGDIVYDRTANGRRTAQFVSKTPILPFFSIQSARYQLKTRPYKGVQLAVYYDAQHPWNVDRMMRSMELSLDYYQANFSPYQFKQLRYLEFPDYARFAQSFAGTIPWSEGLGFIANNSDPTKIDMVTYIGAHEVGHQWWAHQLIGADQQGSTLLSETLAQYSSMMVMKRLYGPDMMRKFLKFELDSYLRSRGGDVLDEQPLIRVEDQGYIHYRKGAVVMYRLADEIGEDAINRALRKLLAQYAFKGAPYATSQDLVAALRAEAPADKQQLITDLFEKITLYDIQSKSMVVKARGDGRYDVTLTVEAKKVYADGKGKETPQPLNETMDVGLFSAQPGDKDFAASKVILFERRPIRSGTQTFTFTVNRKPVWGGADPYNKVIDRNSQDNLIKAK